MSRTRGKKKKEKLLTQQHNYAKRTVSVNQFEAIQGDDEFTKCSDLITYASVATTTDNSTTTEHEYKNINNLMNLGKNNSGSTKVQQRGGKNYNNSVTNAWIQNKALATAKIVTRKKTPIVSRPTTPIIMTDNVPNLTATIKQLINLVTNKTQTIDGTCVMEVALHQQGIYNFDDLRLFNFKDDFENFSPSIKKIILNS